MRALVETEVTVDPFGFASFVLVSVTEDLLVAGLLSGWGDVFDPSSSESCTISRFRRFGGGGGMPSKAACRSSR